MDPRQLGLSDEDLAALGYDVGKKGPPPPGGAAGLPLLELAPTGSGPAARRAPVAVSITARAGRRWFWTTAILLAGAWASSTYRQRPAPTPANRPDTVFSSGRAMSQLVEVVGRPRPVGSPEHERVQRYLEERLRTLGLETETRVITAGEVDDGSAVSATLHNVVARLPGSQSTGAVLLTAHYDGVPISAGGGDDGVGMAAILETLRVMRAGGVLRNDVIVLFADGGELGGLGARAFADSDPWAADVAFVVSLEMGGVAGPTWIMEDEESNARVVRSVASATRRGVAGSIARALGADAHLSEALSPFRERSVPGVTLAGLGGGEAYHQSLDVSERVSERSLAHHGAELVALTRELGAADLGAAAPAATESLAYFSLTAAGVLAYPAAWALLGTIGLWIAWIALALLFRVRGGNPRRLGAGAALAAVVVGASAAVGWALREILQTAHSEFGRLSGAVYNDGIHDGALLATAVAIAVLAYGGARRRFSRAELYLGALAAPLVMLAWVTFSAPSAASALQPALVVAVVLAALVTLVFPNRLGGRGAWAGTLALVLLLMWTAVPGLEWVTAVLTPRAGPTLAAVLATGVLLVLPITDWLLAPWTWLTPAVAAVVAAGSVTIALPGIQGEERHPELTSLVLLVDDTMIVAAGPITAAVDQAPPGATETVDSSATVPGTGSAAAPTASTPAAASEPTTAPQESADSARLVRRRTSGSWLTVPGPGAEWAQSWVVPGPAGPREPGDLLLPEGVDWRAEGAGTAPELVLPLVDFVAHSVSGGTRRLVLSIRPGLDAELVGLRLADDAAGAVIAVDGHALSATDGSTTVRRVSHWGRSASGRVTFELRLDAASPVAFDVIEHQLRPAEILGDAFFVRDRTVIPDASTGSDRLVRRVLVRLSTS